MVIGVLITHRQLILNQKGMDTLFSGPYIHIVHDGKLCNNKRFAFFFGFYGLVSRPLGQTCFVSYE